MNESRLIRVINEFFNHKNRLGKLLCLSGQLQPTLFQNKKSAHRWPQRRGEADRTQNTLRRIRCRFPALSMPVARQPPSPSVAPSQRLADSFSWLTTASCELSVFGVFRDFFHGTRAITELIKMLTWLKNSNRLAPKRNQSGNNWASLAGQSNEKLEK